MKTEIRSLLLAVCLMTPAFAGPVFDVQDDKGRIISIELIEVAGDNVTFHPATDLAKTFTLPIARFAAASQQMIKEKGAALPPLRPKLEIDISVSNRRIKDKEIFYIMNQTVSTRHTIKNLDAKRAYPNSKAKLIFIAQERRTPDTYKVVLTEEFTVEVEASKTQVLESKEYRTRYDGESKGASNNNVGGFQYSAYIFGIFDENGDVVEIRTSDAGLRAMLEKDKNFQKQVLSYKDDKVIDKNLK